MRRLNSMQLKTVSRYQGDVERAFFFVHVTTLKTIDHTIPVAIDVLGDTRFGLRSLSFIYPHHQLRHQNYNNELPACRRSKMTATQQHTTTPQHRTQTHGAHRTQKHRRRSCPAGCAWMCNVMVVKEKAILGLLHFDAKSCYKQPFQEGAKKTQERQNLPLLNRFLF